MSERFQIPIAMWRVQYQLQGGHRRVGLIVSVALVLEVIAAIAFRRVLPREPLAEICGYILYALAVFQVAMMYFGGANAVYRAMLRDYESKMIESHRMTPMSNSGVAIGYLFGPTILMMLLFSVTTLFGAVITAIANPQNLSAIGEWFQGNGLLFIGAASVWALVVFWGMRPGKPFSPAPILVGLGAFGAPILMHPGAGAALGVYAAFVSFWMLSGRNPMNTAGTIALGFVSSIATIFWTAIAAVKYRRPDLPALNAWRGLLLLILWLALSTVGMMVYESVQGASSIDSDRELLRAQWIATMIAALAIAALVTMSTASCRLLVAEGRMPRGRADRLHEYWIAALAAVLICGMMATCGWTVWPEVPDLRGADGYHLGCFREPWLPSLIVCAASLGTTAALYRIAAAQFRLKSPFVASAMILALSSALPVVADLLRSQLLHPNGPLRLTSLFVISPVGSIITIWVPLKAPIEIGIGVQLAVMVLLLLVARYFGPARSPATEVLV